MITVKHFRLDDRLVHGQIVTAWVNDCKCNKMIVADDKAANNSLSKKLFSLAVPRQIEFVLVTVEEAIQLLLDESHSGDTLLIVGNLEAALAIFEKVKHLKSLNVGNISAKTGRKQYSKSVFLTMDEIEIAKQIMALSVEVYVQVVPNEKRYAFYEVVK